MICFLTDLAEDVRLHAFNLHASIDTLRIANPLLRARSQGKRQLVKHLPPLAKPSH